MDSIIEKRLEKGVFSDENEYFITFLSDRFEYLNVLWAKALEKRFDKKFKPIFILSAKQNELFRNIDGAMRRMRFKRVYKY